MDLPTSVSSFTSGSAIQDTVTPGLATVTSQTSNMSGLSGIPGMSSALTTINSMVSSATAAWQSLLAQLPVALPAMKAVHVLESKLSMANGGVASTAGSTSFQSYFGAIDNVKSQITALSSSVTSSITAMGTQAAAVAGVVGSGPSALASLASKIPPATILDPGGSGQQVTNPAYTSFMSTNAGAVSNLTSSAGSLSTLASTANTNVTAQFSAATSAFTAGTTTLKSMAFSSFCSQPQPAAVQAVINKTVDTTKLASPTQLSQAAKSTSAWLHAQGATSGKGIPLSQGSSNPDSAKANVAPSSSSFTPALCTLTQLSNIANQVDAQINICVTSAANMDSANTALGAWKTAHNYDAAKNNKDSDPATYNALRAQGLASAEYQASVAANAQYDIDKQKLNKLIDINHYMNNTGPWPGNPNGPW